MELQISTPKASKITAPLLVLLFVGMLSSCASLETILSNSLANAESELENTSRALVRGATTELQESAAIDSLAESLIATAFTGVQGGLDSLDLSKASNQIKLAILEAIFKGVLSETYVDSIQQRLEPLLNAMTTTLTGSLSTGISEDLIPVISQLQTQLLDPAFVANLASLRDSLIGPGLTEKLDAVLASLLEEAANNPDLDQVLAKVDGLVASSTDRAEGTVKVLRRQIMALLTGLAFVLLSGGFIIWIYFKERSKARVSEKLAVSLTEAIDEIPSRAAYDELTDRIRSKTAKERLDQHLRELLKANKERYSNKKKYKSSAPDETASALMGLLHDQTPAEVKDWLIKEAEKKHPELAQQLETTLY